MLCFLKDALLRQFQQEIELLKKQLADLNITGDGGEESDEEEEVIDPTTGEKRIVRRKKGSYS